MQARLRQLDHLVTAPITASSSIPSYVEARGSQEALSSVFPQVAPASFGERAGAEAFAFSSLAAALCLDSVALVSVEFSALFSALALVLLLHWLSSSGRCCCLCQMPDQFSFSLPAGATTRGALRAVPSSSRVQALDRAPRLSSFQAFGKFACALIFKALRPVRLDFAYIV